MLTAELMRRVDRVRVRTREALTYFDKTSAWQSPNSIAVPVTIKQNAEFAAQETYAEPHRANTPESSSGESHELQWMISHVAQTVKQCPQLQADG
jgi:hypothetical protein